MKKFTCITICALSLMLAAGCKDDPVGGTPINPNYSGKVNVAAESSKIVSQTVTEDVWVAALSDQAFANVTCTASRVQCKNGELWGTTVSGYGLSYKINENGSYKYEYDDTQSIETYFETVTADEVDDTTTLTAKQKKFLRLHGYFAYKYEYDKETKTWSKTDDDNEFNYAISGETLKERFMICAKDYYESFTYSQTEKAYIAETITLPLSEDENEENTREYANVILKFKDNKLAYMEYTMEDYGGREGNYQTVGILFYNYNTTTFTFPKV